MRRVTGVILFAVFALTFTLSAAAQPTPRRLAFAEVASTALQNSLQLRVAMLDVAVAEAQLAQARGAKNPQVSVSGSYTRSQEQAGQTLTFPNPFGPTPPEITVTLTPPDPNMLAVRLGVEFPLYTGGRVEAQIALAEAGLRGARAVFARTAQLVVFSAEQTYLQILLAQENVTAARRTLAQAEESLRVARARVQAGATPEFDVLQADVAVAGARQGLVRPQTAAQNAQAELNAMLTLPLATQLEPTDTLESRPVPGTLEAAIARATRERPELAELRARMDAARAASGARPNVVLGAYYDVGGSPSNLSGTWSVMLALTLSLSDGGITRERIREAELRLEQLKVLGAQTKQRIELEVRQAWLALEQAGAELTAAVSGVEQGREAARIAGVRYQAGGGISLELVSTQAALAQAELALASARFSQNVARIRLILAAGGSL